MCIRFGSVVLTAFFMVSTAGVSSAQNSITGLVFNAQRRAVADISVELFDELERLKASTETNGSGL
ncbi:MAG: hypothetical protein HKN33_18650 [Pyrinomonadaceae bacterium]|nr:hypothetical protein [Pyrinomonadaceae bacterium]